MVLNHVITNTKLNLLGALVPLLVGLATVPFLAKSLPMEVFGFLTLLWTVIGYFSFFDLGIGRAITVQASFYFHKNDFSSANLVSSYGLFITFAIGVFLGIIIYFLRSFLVFDVLKISPHLVSDAIAALGISCLAIPLSTCTASLRGTLEAIQNFHRSNICKIALGSTTFSFPVISILLGYSSLSHLAFSLLLARLISFLIFFFMSYRHISLCITRSFNMFLIKDLFAGGLWMNVSGILNPILINADKFIITHILGTAILPHYSIPMEFLTRILIFPSAIGTTLLPLIAKHHNDQTIDTTDALIKITSLNKWILGSLLVMVSIIAFPLMQLTLGVDFARDAILPTLIICIGIYVNGTAFLHYTSLHAKGRAKIVGLAHVGEAFIYLPVLYISVFYFGIVGAAFAWTFRVSLDNFLLANFNKSPS